ncbi:hypothetical protein ACFFQW_40690 [Umezawaea endophytica]|uniref:Beta-lactamase family protein n=1 Tax=Umezawaea endophytica TaxID=1654476 RepID=A0A9X2VI15_9PSEU|nr:beta-lactamase family protein [Umezawaea endophytica]MCS7477095.1 beta-lactamase family protein [Umezawaea endophytica]
MLVGSEIGLQQGIPTLTTSHQESPHPPSGVRDYTAGVGDLATRSPVPVNGQVRVASNTKTFVATVVL